MAVGRHQNWASVTSTPMVATVSAASAMTRSVLNRMLTSQPTTPTRPGTVMCQRRSRAASDRRPTVTMATAAAP
jgi:hypothetical protein